MELIITLMAFGFIVIASKQVGEYLVRFKFPLISGYILGGIIAGPFVLKFIDSEGIHQLRFIDELSLAFIAFAAGSEMHIEELRSRIRSISYHITGQVIAIYGLGTLAVYLLANYIPFMENLSDSGRLAAALLAGAILVARSPSSAIAIINELRAKGPFTKTILGVTILKDVVVVIVFAISTSIADLLLTSGDFSISFLFIVSLELAMSILLGYVLGQALRLILSAHLNKYLKTTLIILAGYGIFVFSAFVRDYTHEHLPYELLIEPLLICMVGSFWVTNFTTYRAEFVHILEEAGPTIYVIFFTLVGDAVSLDVLAQTWPIALALFSIRLFAIFIGSFTAGTLAGDPMLHNRVAWMSYITQAGIGLGLAKQAADEFGVYGIGDDFATMMISVIVIGQLVGPPFFKMAVRRVGEAHVFAEPQPDEVRDVVILGVNAHSRALARRLQVNNWQSIIVDTNSDEVQHCVNDEIQAKLIADVSKDSLSGIITRATDAVVAMMDDDANNLLFCEIACEEFGIPRRVVRLNDLTWAERFRELDVDVVYPVSAVVNTLDQHVRTPHTAHILMQQDDHNHIEQITITEKDVDGLPLRDLNFPGDILVLGIMRNGDSIVPHGYTVVNVGDDITVIGSEESLKQMKLNLGY